MAKANKLLTSKHLQTLFAVSHMAIQAWRKGGAKREPLPVTAVDDNPRAIGFAPAQVKAWAKKHGIALHGDPATFLAEAVHAEPDPKLAAKTLTAKDSKGKIVKVQVKTVISKPVAKKAATAIRQKPVKKAPVKSGKSIPALRKEIEEKTKPTSPLKGTKVAAAEPRTSRRAVTPEAQFAA